jgi:hypothetical protein
MKPLAIFLLGFTFRAIIIVANPIVWGGDTIIRLFDRHNLTMGHNLPMLQILISAVSRISMNPVLVQYMVATIGAAAGLGFYWLIADLFGERWALPGALLFISHPYLLAISTVPYQEILMLAGLLFAFHFFYTRRWPAASICLAIACFTRFEAWTACPVLAVAWCLQKDRSLAGAIRAALLFGWAPVAWILARHGLTSTGHFAIETFSSIWRVQRWAYLVWITMKFSQLPVLLLATAGVWKLVQNCKRHSQIDWRLWVQIAFVALLWATILFSAHGVMPDPERYVTSREATIPMYFVLLFAAFGLSQLPRWTTAIVSLSVVLGIAGAFWYVHVQSAVPEVRVDYQVAQYLDHSVQPGERVLILAHPISQGDTRLYLDKALKTGGEQGLQQARLELQKVAATPPDYQRVVVYSRLDRDRFLAPPAGCAQWVTVWNDYPETNPELTGATPVKTIQSAKVSVRVLRRECPRNPER